MTTTPYHIQIAPQAYQDILLLTSKQQKQLIKLIETLAINPRPIGHKKIDGLTGLYCQEIDQSRLLYKVEEQEVLLLRVK